MSDPILTCPRCRLQYPASLGPCPQCRERERAAAGSPAGRLATLRRESAYKGSRAIVGVLTALSLLGAVLAAILATQPDQSPIPLGVLSAGCLLGGAVQHLVLNALLDLADAALRHPSA